MASPAPPMGVPAGPFPREHLTPGEAVLFETRPHFVAFVLPAALVGLILIPILLPFVLLPTFGMPFEPFAFVCLGPIILFLLLPLVAQILRYGKTAYAISSQRILSTTGIIGRTVVQCTHDRVQNVTFHQGILGRLTGSGTLVFATAGMGAGVMSPFWGGGMPMLGGNVAFFALPEPTQVKRIAEQIIEGSRRASRAQELQDLSAVVAATSPPLRFCLSCGTARVPGAAHCGQCGARFA